MEHVASLPSARLAAKFAELLPAQEAWLRAHAECSIDKQPIAPFPNATSTKYVPCSATIMLKLPLYDALCMQYAVRGFDDLSICASYEDSGLSDFSVCITASKNGKCRFAAAYIAALWGRFGAVPDPFKCVLPTPLIYANVVRVDWMASLDELAVEVHVNAHDCDAEIQQRLQAIDPDILTAPLPSRSGLMLRLFTP